jgi:hypothetical protein
LRVSLTDFGVLALGFAAGAALPAGAITADAARMLITFLGLVAASILPAVTLMVNSIASGGRSVRAIELLGGEARRLIAALFIVLALTGAAVLALVALSTPTPWRLPSVLGVAEYRIRFGQGVALAVILVTLNRTRVVPSTIFRCLRLKTEMVVEEAKQRVEDHAPKPGEIAATFSNKPGFGAVRTLEEARGK